ncbi:MAG: putative secreted protein [Marmoricola sp.]|nr:putative secreted protein [Marmoricola sp.]
MLRASPALLFLALDIFCLIDVITSDEDRVRHLPKMAWFLLILLVPAIGSVIWLFAGRPQGGPGRGGAYERPATAYPEYDRPGRAAGLTPESDQEFLTRVRERAEEQRRKEAENRRRAQEGGPGTGTEH